MESPRLPPSFEDEADGPDLRLLNGQAGDSVSRMPVDTARLRMNCGVLKSKMLPGVAVFVLLFVIPLLCGAWMTPGENGHTLSGPEPKFADEYGADCHCCFPGVGWRCSCCASAEKVQ